MKPLKLAVGAFAGFVACARAHAWQPSKDRVCRHLIPGGGTDNFTCMIQSIITKYKLIEQPIVVVNKGGGSGAEGYLTAKTASGDPHKVIFGTNNAYLLPYVAKLAYKPSELTPVAAMALDEFVLWVRLTAAVQDQQDYWRR
jgi:tripartite-type tricarboxylate transporter receptor subunit TctC